MADDEDKPYDAGDPKDVKAAVKASQRWEDRRTNVILAVMASDDGRRWIRETLALCKVGVNPFSNDALNMAFTCGELNVGNQFMAQIMNASPKLYMQMMAEANDRPTKDTDNG